MKENDLKISCSSEQKLHFRGRGILGSNWIQPVADSSNFEVVEGVYYFQYLTNLLGQALTFLIPKGVMNLNLQCLKVTPFHLLCISRKFREMAEARAGNLKHKFVLVSLLLAMSAGWPPKGRCPLCTVPLGTNGFPWVVTSIVSVKQKMFDCLKIWCENTCWKLTQ